MHPETWLYFPIDGEEDLDGMRVFFIFFFGFKSTTKKSMLIFCNFEGFLVFMTDLLSPSQSFFFSSCSSRVLDFGFS